MTYAPINNIRLYCMDHSHFTRGIDEGWNPDKIGECPECGENLIKTLKSYTIKELIKFLILPDWEYAREFIKMELQKRKNDLMIKDDKVWAFALAQNPKRYKDWVLIK